MGTIFKKNLREENKPKNTLCVCKFLPPKNKKIKNKKINIYIYIYIYIYKKKYGEIKKNSSTLVI
jgi:hypothetical protein